MAVVGALALIYWQLIIAEGTYLGPRMVAWTYDLVASRYDAIKQFVPHDEHWFVADPLLRALDGVKWPLVLDVATGTGRLPLALLREHFQGQIVGLDISRGMLRQARAKLQLYGDQVRLLWQDASALPFGDGTFDAVACLESLEFMPRPLEALSEMVRVLAPGGVLFVTNRVGREAHLLPRRALPRLAFRQALATLPLDGVEIRRWQVQYDLAIARKLNQTHRAGPRNGWDSPALASKASDQLGTGDLESLLRCPTCHGKLLRRVAKLACPGCQRDYPIREGVVFLADSEE
jgi:ubiquinone/menaquinone biosynthesis C-methylase UbiE